MANRVVVRFPEDRPYGYYIGVFEFAESLWDPIVNRGLGTLNDIDHARETIWVDVAAKRHLGAVKAVIKKQLQKHGLAADATLRSE